MPTSLRSFVQMAVELGYEDEDPTTATLTPFDPQDGNEGEGRGERDEEGQPDLLGDLGQLSYTDPHHHQGQGLGQQEYDQRHDRSDTLDGDPHYNHSIHPFSNDDIIGHNSDPSSPRTEISQNNNVPKPKIKFQKAVISPFNYTLSSLALTPTTTTTTTSNTNNNYANNSSSNSCKIVPPSKEGGDFIPPPKLAVPTPQTHTSSTNNNSSGTIGSSSGGMVGPGSSSVHSSTATTSISNEKGRRKGQNYDKSI